MTEAQVLAGKRRFVDKVIDALRHGDALTAAQLRERLGGHHGTVTMTLGRLRSVGLVERSNDIPPRWRLTRPL